jgi:hypothetical protein
MIEAIKQNPIPAALIGAGLGYLLFGPRPGRGANGGRRDEGASEGLVGQVQAVGETVGGATGSHPIVAGVAAALAGAALGLSLPMSTREKGAMSALRGKLVEGVQGAAKGTARQVTSRAKQVTGRTRRKKTEE